MFDALRSAAQHQASNYDDIRRVAMMGDCIENVEATLAVFEQVKSASPEMKSLILALAPLAECVDRGLERLRGTGVLCPAEMRAVRNARDLLSVCLRASAP